MARSNAWLPLLLSVWLASGAALAQETVESLAEVERAAMDAYNNLDIEIAQQKLETAVARAERAGINGPALARAYTSLGVVCVGGLRDESCGFNAFVRALQEDPNVEPDPLVGTPEIQRVFLQAKAKASTFGTRPGAKGTAEGNLTHAPINEQLTQAGVPVYVEPSPLPIAKMQVYYRSLGMPEPKIGDMHPVGAGWGYVIPCTDVFEPQVEYYVVALDASGKQIGNAGAPDNPVSVSIVSHLSGPAPSLPGQPPIEQCSSDECPPGLPGCKRQGGGPGDTCTLDRDCNPGLTCQDNFCAIASPNDEGDEESAEDLPKFFVDIGASYGAAYVGQNMKADSSPPASLFAGQPGNLTAAQAQALANAAGWACQVREADRTLYDCTVAVETPGFVQNLAAQALIGYHVAPRVYLGLAGRLQIGGTGQGTLAGVVVGPRLGYLISEPKESGVRASLFAGADIGQIQVRPKSQAGGGPYVASGLGGLALGTSLGYRFARNVGIVMSPQAHFMLPTFLFVIDAVGAVEIAF